MRTFSLGRTFDAVISINSGIGYLTSEAHLAQAVHTMAAHLNPGGVLLVEGWVEPDYWLADAGASLDTATDGDLAVARLTRTRRSGTVTELFVRYDVASKDDTHSIDEHHVLRSDPTEFERAYTSAGLTFERLPHMLRAGRAVYAGTSG